MAERLASIFGTEKDKYVLSVLFLCLFPASEIWFWFSFFYHLKASSHAAVRLGTG
jgi:hypothetical protein